MVTSFILWTIMAGLYESRNGQGSFGIAQIVFVWIFGVFYSIGFSGLLVSYTLEILPFHLRAKGVMIMNITVQAILAISAQTNPIAIEKLPHAWNFWLFYTVRSTFPRHFNVFDVLYSLIHIFVCSFGISLRQSGSTSSLSRLKALPSRKLPRYSMVRMPGPTST